MRLMILKSQIRFKLIMAFCVPVILIIALGIFSYQTSKGAVFSNYQKATQGNIDNSSLYCALLMNDIETKASQIAGNNDFIFYYGRFSTNSVIDSNTYYKNAKQTLNTLVGSSVGIYSAYGFGNVGNPMSTLVNAPSANLYSEFTSSEEANQWKEAVAETSGLKSTWMGYHDVIDKGTGALSEFYAATYIRSFSKGEGYIVFDLLKSKIQEVLDNTIVSDRSIVAFITADGRETIAAGKKRSISDVTDENKAFAGKDFYQKTVNNDKESGFEYVKDHGKANLFVYSKIGNTGVMICTLIPKSDILSQLGTIRMATILFVLVACVIAILIGLYLSNDIGGVINKFSLSFKQVSAGDFTVRVGISRTDEFGTLAQNMDNMLMNIRELVGDMAKFGQNVSSSTRKVSGASEQILTSINEVSETVIAMEQGVNEQVKDSENCFTQMSNFAEQIGEAYEDSEQVGIVADKTQQIIHGGKNIVQTLMEQVTATAEITNVIIKDIDELELQSKSIGGVIETIDNIAATTNLLSLNASIEAARAGIAGRGFAVVAEQIRSLAEQSVESVQSIEKIIKNIQQKTRTTASSASRAEQMLGRQTEALNNTVEVFQNVDSHMVELMDKINHILKNMQTITISKDEVLDSIKNIAVVTEQTASASEEVEATVINQITSVAELNALAEDMKDKAKELEAAIAKFLI